MLNGIHRKNLGVALGMFLAVAMTCGYAQPAASALAPGKIMLLVVDVGTIDTVAKTEEYLSHIKEVYTDDVPKLSPAQAISDPQLAKEVNRNTYYIELNRYKAQDREIAARNRRMERILEGVRNSVIGRTENRDLVVAKNYLQSFLQPYSAFIGIIDRANTTLSEVEKQIGDKGQQDVSASTCFLTVIVQDLQEESDTVQVGNTMVKKTTYTRKAVANLRDYNGNVLAAFHVVGKSTHRRTSASRNVGHNPSSEIMEDLMKQIADKVAAHFLTKLTVKCTGPKGDADFDADNVTLYVDGEEFENGGMVIVGNHSILATCDGYKDIVRPVTVKNGAKGRAITLKFKK